MSMRKDSGTSVDAGLSTRRATDADQRAALRYEASLLQMLRHPGVTELIRITDGDDATELTTRSGSDQTLADWDGTHGDAVDTAVIVGVLASLSTTCADLHDLGVVHGRIEPQRVAMPPSGQPVLMGFQAAGPIGARRPEAEAPLPPFCDPAGGPAHPLNPATDVFGLGALLEHLLERHPPTSSDPARAARRRLRRLARSATGDQPDRRPDAASFATALLDATPAAHLPGDHTSDRPPETQRTATLHRPAATLEPSGSRRRIRPLIAGVAAVLVGVVALLTLSRSRPPAPSGTAMVSHAGDVAPTITSVRTDGPTDGADDSSTATSAPTATTATPAAPTTEPPPPSTALPAAPSSADTTTVVFDGARYEIGGGQRRWAIGDWDCDGDATLATLDPSSGSLTFFEEWPQSGSTRAVAADRMPGAVDLRARSSGDCHELLIVHGDHIDTYESTGGTQ